MLGQFESFGEEEFIKGQPYNVSATCVSNFGSVYVLNRMDYVVLMMRFPNLADKMMEIA